MGIPVYANAARLCALADMGYSPKALFRNVMHLLIPKHILENSNLSADGTRNTAKVPTDIVSAARGECAILLLGTGRTLGFPSVAAKRE